MNKNKSKKILIAIIILVILIAIMIGGIAFAYFATDIFKTDQELFFKYAGQLFNEENGLIDNAINKYYQKKQNTPYENEGKITFDIDNQSIEDILDAVNNSNISFSGKVDTQNNKCEQNIKLNYSEDVVMPISYRQSDKTLGLQTKYVGSKYIAIDSERISEISDMLGIDISNEDISKIEDVSKTSITQEDLQYVQEKYLNLIYQELDAESFSRVNDSNGQGYKLTITLEKLKPITIKLLDEMKNDSDLLSKLNISSEEIEQLSESLNLTEETSELQIEITVYQEKGICKKITIKINKAIIEIEKTKGQDEIQFSIKLKDENEANQFYITAKYTGIQTNSVEENIKLGMEISISNEIIERAEAASKKATLGQEKETVKLLFQAAKVNSYESGLREITIDVIEKTINADNYYNDLKVEKLTDTTFKITFLDNNHSYEIDNKGKILKEPEEDDVEIEKQAEKYHYEYNYDNIVNFTENVEIEELDDENAIILNDLDDETAQTLLNAIGERIVTVNKNQMEELDLSEDQNPILNANPFFTAMRSFNNTLFSTVEVGLDKIEEEQVRLFNNKFLMYQSTNTKGATAKGLLTVIQANNAENDTKITEINFDGEEYEVTDQNITLIKSNILIEEAYKIEFEYDRDTGMIYRAIINKK